MTLHSFLDVAEDLVWTVKSRDALDTMLNEFVDGRIWSETQVVEFTESIDFHIQMLGVVDEEPIILIAATESDSGELSFHARVAPLSGIHERVEMGLWKVFSDCPPSYSDYLN